LTGPVKRFAPLRETGPAACPSQRHSDLFRLIPYSVFYFDWLILLIRYVSSLFFILVDSLTVDLNEQNLHYNYDKEKFTSNKAISSRGTMLVSKIDALQWANDPS
jgi:hypothetical protein